MEFFNRAQSEDLPHVSGIKTTNAHNNNPIGLRRKTCPTYRGLRLHCPVIVVANRVGRLAPRIGD